MVLLISERVNVSFFFFFCQRYETAEGSISTLEALKGVERGGHFSLCRVA